MLGTKMRALFQRKRGRDLFDLYLGAHNGDTRRGSGDRHQSRFSITSRQEKWQRKRAEFVGESSTPIWQIAAFAATCIRCSHRIGLRSKEAGKMVKAKLFGSCPDSQAPTLQQAFFVALRVSAKRPRASTNIFVLCGLQKRGSLQLIFRVANDEVSAPDLTRLLSQNNAVNAGANPEFAKVRADSTPLPR